MNDGKRPIRSRTAPGSAKRRLPDGSNCPPFSEILVLSQYFWPETGAPQIRLRAMARELQSRGIGVRVLTGMPNYPTGKIDPRYQGRWHSRESLEGIPIERVWLYAAAGRGSWKRLASYLSFTLMVIPWLLFGKKPDLVFVEAQPLSLAFPAWLLKVLRGVPYVYNTPDLQCEVAADQKWIGLSFLVGLAKALEAFFMRQALSVSTVTHAFMQHFREHRNIPQERISFLPNGADTRQLRPLPYDAELAQALGVGNRKVFTYAGTHAHYQGLEVIVEAAQQLRDQSDIVIVMVGKGPVREQLIRQAEAAQLSNILFRECAFEEMARLMSITYASLVVLKDMPAARKMRLSKAVPPLACGVPIIYAGRGESATITERERCGVVIEPERPDLLARAIRELAAHPVQRNEMGRRGRLLVERDFAWNRLVGDWLRQITCIHQGQSPSVPDSIAPAPLVSSVASPGVSEHVLS